jgi:hypothetical protein
MALGAQLGSYTYVLTGCGGEGGGGEGMGNQKIQQLSPPRPLNGGEALLHQGALPAGTCFTSTKVQILIDKAGVVFKDTTHFFLRKLGKHPYHTARYDTRHILSLNSLVQKVRGTFDFEDALYFT